MVCKTMKMVYIGMHTLILVVPWPQDVGNHLEKLSWFVAGALEGRLWLQLASTPPH